MADLTTVAAVKQWLGIKDATGDDTLLSSLVSGVSAWVENDLGRTIASATYTYKLNGNGKDVIFLPDTPITAVSSVLVDGVAIPARTSFGGSGYTFDEDGIYLDGYCFTRGRQNVQIADTAGYASTPADLELATKKLCAFLYREKDRIGLSSKGLSGEQTMFITKAMPADVAEMLSNFRRVVPLVL